MAWECGRNQVVIISGRMQPQKRIAIVGEEKSYVIPEKFEQKAGTEYIPNQQVLGIEPIRVPADIRNLSPISTPHAGPHKHQLSTNCVGLQLQARLNWKSLSSSSVRQPCVGR